MFFCPHLFQPLDPEAPRTGGPGYCSGRTWEHFHFLRLHPPEDSCGLTLRLPEVELHFRHFWFSRGGPQGRECQNEEGWVSPTGLGLSPSSSKPFCL